MTRLSAKQTSASMRCFSGASAVLPPMRDFIDNATCDSHDRVMLFGDGTDPSADSASLTHRMIISWCSACDPVTRWQSDHRPPTLHMSAKVFEAADAITIREAVQVKPFNPDITPNERSGR